MELNVNAMSEAKKVYLMKKGACFKCEVAGHLTKAGHKWIRGFLAGSGICAVALNFLNILQFFLCKSIKN
jgi:hypothetical protein